MIQKYWSFIALYLLASCIHAGAQDIAPPHGLSVNMLYDTHQVYLNGYPAATPLEEAVTYGEDFQYIEISTAQPVFGWMPTSSLGHEEQSAYRIWVARDKDMLANDSADAWDSGKIDSNQTLHIPYGGRSLEPGTIYYWKVKTWNQAGIESSCSPIASFITAQSLSPYATDRYPIQKQDEHPASITRVDDNIHFADFGKASFGRLRVTLYSDTGTDTIAIHLGEAEKEGRVDRSPGGTIRYARYLVTPREGWNTYLIAIRPDPRNTGPQAIKMPGYIGEVTPFRYCEIENYNQPVRENDLVRETAFYPFNEFESHFESSNYLLNQVWDISKYSIKATSFMGVYIDGDRERIPYEADALINQLSHYGVARDYSMARYTHEYLIHQPTWPTEWIMQSVLMAWEDYMYTGNPHSLAHFYEDLKAKTLVALADENGLISTRTGNVTTQVLESIHFDGELRDIVDWPHTGILGLEKEEGGETDGFVFTDINTVVNAYHYRALALMARVAQVLGETNDQRYFEEQADRVKHSFNQLLFDAQRGVYKDGADTNHASLHANMFPLAFGMVPPERVEGVMEFIRSRGMACSVYGSQFLLDGIYLAHDGDYGLELLTSTGERSWYNMIRAGSTITMEAWDNKYKPNQDWNHAWGAAPANLIPRKLMGIEPIEPGFKKIQIKPQPGTLEWATIKTPTIRGDITMSFENNPGQSFTLEVNIPVNTTAEVHLPFYGERQTILLNGGPTDYHQVNGFSIVEGIGPGSHTFTVSSANAR